MNPQDQRFYEMLYSGMEKWHQGFYPADFGVVVGNVTPKKEAVMAKIQIELQVAENGVYFTHAGKTVVFTDPSVLGDHLFDLALDASDGKASDEPKTFNVFIKGVPSQHAIPQIKAVRFLAGLSLKEAKDLVDLARVTSTRQLLLSGVTKEAVNLCIREVGSSAISEINNCLEWEAA